MSAGMDAAVKQIRKGLVGRILSVLGEHRDVSPGGQHGGRWCSCGWQAKRYSGVNAHDRHLAKKIVGALFRPGRERRGAITSAVLPHTTQP